MFRSTTKLTLLAVTFVGCASFGKSQPDGNYVPITGLVCTSPQMVDGDLKTSDTLYIKGSAGMGERTVTTPNSLWADVFAPTTVNLPTECNVRMVVLHGENLRNFKVLARDGK